MESGELKFSKRRHLVKQCPCGKSNKDGKFVPYEGHDDKGYCHSCNQTFLPNIVPDLTLDKTLSEPEPEPPTQYISREMLTLSLGKSNTFIEYLHTLFNDDTVKRLVDIYKIGTSKDGWCVFWQIDDEQRIRTGKLIKYKPDGHRDKDLHANWVHSRLNIRPIKQCLFGLHLVDDSKPIGLVESEKTAVIMAGKLPNFIWVSCGSSGNTSQAYDIRGRKVVVFPDGNAFDDWKEKLSPYGFKISDALQKYLTPDEQKKGVDVADFVTPVEKITESKYALSEYDGAGNLIDPLLGYPVTWQQERVVEKYPIVNELIQRFQLTT